MLRLNTPYLSPPPLPPPAASQSLAPTTPGDHASASLLLAGTQAVRPVVISASHFLPHPASPSSPAVRELRKAVGCAHLLPQLAALGSDCHVYGHTHINGCSVLADPPEALTGQGQSLQRPAERRYVQFALEAAFDAGGGGGKLPGLMCIWDGRELTHREVDVLTGV
jgi:hypothetical protein